MELANKRCNNGGSRAVYFLEDGTVLKIGRGYDGKVQNDNEDYIYKNCPTELIDLLCPVLSYDSENMTLIIREAGLFNEKDKKTHSQWKKFLKVNHEKIENLVFEFDLEEFDIWDCCFNWGIIDGKFVLIDYGTTDFCEMDELDYA